MIIFTARVGRYLNTMTRMSSSVWLKILLQVYCLSTHLTQLKGTLTLNSPLPRAAVYMITNHDKLTSAGYKPGPGCGCSECNKLKVLEDKWKCRLGSYNRKFRLNDGSETNKVRTCFWAVYGRVGSGPNNLGMGGCPSYSVEPAVVGWTKRNILHEGAH